MSESIKGATKLIEQGHVRVGPELVKDPAFLVSRTLEDFVTWVDNSAIRKHVLQYNNMVSKHALSCASNKFTNNEYQFSFSERRLYLLMNVTVFVSYFYKLV